MAFAAAMMTSDQFAAARQSSDFVVQLLEGQPDDGRSVDLDKAWHAIHFLLTGSGDPEPSAADVSGWRRLVRGRRRQPDVPTGAESLAIFGGEPTGNDIGYGPARVLAPAQVADIASALLPLDREALGRRVDLDAMAAADLYPQIWDEPDVYEEYVGPLYDELRSFYQRAAAANAAVVLAIF